VILLRASPVWPQTPGTISGSVVDATGAPVAGAAVTLSHEDSPAPDEVFSREDGQFSLANVAAGRYRLTISASGFAARTVSGVLNGGEGAALSPIQLTIAAGAVAVDVTATRVEVAERQIRQQEQQRLFGVVPNFYISYLPDAAPLNMRQKFQLSWKSRVDPVRFAFVGITAGIQQARNDYSGFGDGAEGYAKRYAAAYGNSLTRSLISQVLLPSVFKQDPRYFYKGTGSTASRIGYALSRAVIKKGDNGRWQPNYSGVLGSLASGAISNLYYPPEDRRGVGLTFENTAIGLAGAAAGNVAQELLFRKLTTHSRRP